MNSPLDYSLCCQCVTVYRLQAGQVCRYVADGVSFSERVTQTVDALGQHCRRAFTLILPGSQVGIAPGDRVYEGIGPTVTAEQWDGFIPAAQPRLWQVESVQPFYWEGTVCHVQAEGEKE